MNKEDNEEDERTQVEEELYKAAVEIVRDTGRCSASFLQQKLHIGYNKAARLLDLLEENGVVYADKDNQEQEWIQSIVRENNQAKKVSLHDKIFTALVFVVWFLIIIGCFALHWAVGLLAILLPILLIWIYALQSVN